MRGEDNLRTWLMEHGFKCKDDPFETRDNQCDWYAYRRTELDARECEHNTGKGMPVLVKPFTRDFSGYLSRSVAVELGGEYGGDWYDLNAYAINPDELPDKLDDIEARLVKAWNALSC